MNKTARTMHHAPAGNASEALPHGGRRAGKDGVVLSNTMTFARNVCRSIAEMSGEQFLVRPDTLTKEYISRLSFVTVFVQFYGTITGQYLISLDENAIAAIGGWRPVEGGALVVDRRSVKQSFEFLKEVINVSAGASIVELEKSFGQLTHLPPVVVTGEIEFPDMLSAGVAIECAAAKALCVANLDLAQLKIGRKLQEAQNKLDTVREWQASMWVRPEHLPQARFSVLYKSLHEAGGDLYEVIKISDEVFGYFVGDVAGHEIGNAFVAASMRALIKQNCVNDADPVESMHIINSVLYELLGDMEYITGCYAVVDRGRGALKIMTMGHPPLIMAPRAGTWSAVSSEGDILGSFEKGNYYVKELSVRGGDRFVMYTDGLLDVFPGYPGPVTKAFHRTVAEAALSASMETMAAEVFYKVRDMKKIIRDDIIVLGVEV